MNATRNPQASRSTVTFYSLLASGVLIALGLLMIWSGDTPAWSQKTATSRLTLADIPFNGERAYATLKEICAIGPRIGGSEGMARQQAYLKDRFERAGGKVVMQEFDVRHPQDGSRVKLANMIVRWHPEKLDRILLCAHYDTRPYPDQDPDFAKRRDTFLGANDGASGAALMCELAEQMPKLASKYGVDFVLFDGEELVYDADRDPYFLGSEHFAREYVANPPAHRYRWGVLVDMIADAELQIFREENSMTWPETRPLVLDIWNTARQLGVKEFINVNRHVIRDDHLALRNIAKIPTCDIIDFDYPRLKGESYWHTTKDVPENCSALSLAKVGWVLTEWLKRVK
jgi:hypothetical protein